MQLFFPAAFTKHGELLVVAEALQRNGKSLRESRPVAFTADEAYQDSIEIRKAQENPTAMIFKRPKL